MLVTEPAYLDHALAVRERGRTAPRRADRAPAVGSTGCASPSPGAAPCAPEVSEFRRGLGLPLCEVYGMSETTGVATVNAPGAARVGTVGRPLPGGEVVLSDAGKVLTRRP